MNRGKTEEYFDYSGIDCNLLNQVVKSVESIDDILGIDHPITHLFVSNEQNNGEVEFDTTLWIFTNTHIIRCIKFKENTHNNKLDCEVIPIGIFKRHNIKATTSMGSLDSFCISIIADKEYVLKSVGYNKNHLLEIYKSIFIK